MKTKTILAFIFPLLIIVFGLIIYKVLEYNPNIYTICINIGLAYLLSPRYKMVDKQNGEEEQIKWLFFKKVINNKL